MAWIDAPKLEILKANGLDFYAANRPLADDFSFEPPCSLKFTTVEHGCSMGAFSYIVSGFMCGVSIGRYCSFGEGVQIGRQNHPMDWLSTSPFLYLPGQQILSAAETFNSIFLEQPPQIPKSPTSLRLTVIKNDVWVGHGAIINAGVTIETGAIIAAGSVVTKDVPAYAIMGGNPAQIIRYRFQATIIARLLESQWWQFTPEQIKSWPFYDIEQFIGVINQVRADIQAYMPNKVNIQKLFLS
ncbi:MAG: CatB-related O-acetyltransferase [Methylococcaceae bacterium]|nr:CatB-related O-acetyltransferase [Methylococcaceae bacterium]